MRNHHNYRECLLSVNNTVATFFALYILSQIPDEQVAETAYEEINESTMDFDGSMDESSWSDEIDETSSNPSDVINYYIQPVNEYENTVLTLYENYMESDGHQDPVSAKDKFNEKKKKDTENTDDDGYEIPMVTLTYDILSNSPVEVFLFVENLDP